MPSGCLTRGRFFVYLWRFEDSGSAGARLCRDSRSKASSSHKIFRSSSRVEQGAVNAKVVCSNHTSGARILPRVSGPIRGMPGSIPGHAGAGFLPRDSYPTCDRGGSDGSSEEDRFSECSSEAERVIWDHEVGLSKCPTPTSHGGCSVMAAHKLVTLVVGVQPSSVAPV